jgi:hypothetical protein
VPGAFHLRLLREACAVRRNAKGSHLDLRGRRIDAAVHPRVLTDAEEIEHTATDLDNLERAKLVDIIRSANELGRQLRRSTRKAASIAVHLCCDRLGDAWEEDTETVLLSRYGASVKCRRPADPRAPFQIVRLDTGQKAKARVVWQRPAASEGSRIGFEFVDCDNFWGFDWAAVDEAR